MKINNIEKFVNKFECNQIMANYLIKVGFIPISSDSNTYYFKKDDAITNAYKNAPFHIRVFGKAV